MYWLAMNWELFNLISGLLTDGLFPLAPSHSEFLQSLVSHSGLA